MATLKDEIEEKIIKVFNPDSMFLISIIGPEQSGKTTLMKSIVNYITKIKRSDTSKIISILNSKKELTILIESGTDIFSNLQCIRLSNLMVFVIDGFFGLELNTFETLTASNNLHFKKYVFALTHLDLFKTWKSLKKAKKRIKDRLMKATNGCCKIFYFSGIKQNDFYFSGEILNLTRYLKNFISKNTLPPKNENYALITKIEFFKAQNKDFTILTGYPKNTLSLANKLSGCFVPGVGHLNILAMEKNVNKAKLLENFIHTKNTLPHKFSGTPINLKNNIQWNKYQKNENICMFLSFLTYSNLKLVKKKIEMENLVLLVDSVKIFNHLTNFSKIKNSLESGSIFENSFCSQISVKPESEYRENLSEIISNIPSNQKSEIYKNQGSFQKQCFITSQFPFELKKYYNKFNLLVLIFSTRHKKRLIVAKINKNRWEKSVLNSGKQYIISIGWKIISTKLYFCEQKGTGTFFINKNLKSNGFYYICFYADYDQKDGQIIGIKPKKLTRNLINQGTSFSFSFSGKIISTEIYVKLFKKIKVKGTLFKKFKKTAFVKNMFHSDMEAIKFKDAIIKTPRGVKGIIKNINFGDSHGLFRVSFEKKIQNESSVTLTTYLSVPIDEKFKEILYNLIPIDQRELSY
jgi:hypothetical protein